MTGAEGFFIVAFVVAPAVVVPVGCKAVLLNERAGRDRPAQ